MMEHASRLLLAGVGPLPPEQPERLHAPGLRIWGMARELARAGHPVRLAVTPFGAETPELLRYDLTPGESIELPEGLPRPLPPGEDGLAVALAAEATEWGADAAVASTDVMNHALAASGLDLPLWLDFFGDPMAERQLLALRAGDDGGLDDQWALVAPALARADRLSGCSSDQCAALLGELAAVGRLGRRTAAERLVHRIPPWLEPIVSDDAPAEGPAFRGAMVPADAYLVVQTGGFNTWLDVEGLFAALEKAMAGDARIQFAATGGAIEGHYMAGFERFRSLVAASPFRDRSHLLGWLPPDRLKCLLAEADLALNVDLPCVEGVLGTRNRLLDWVAAGLAVITTPGSELALELGDEGFVTLVPHGDSAATARALLAAAADPQPRRLAARRGALWLARERTAAVCLRPLLEWASAPRSAPDLHAWRSRDGEPPHLWRQASQAPENLAELRRQAHRAAWLEQKLARLEGSRWVRMALSLRGRDGLDPPTDG